jgi:hypothetical protein
MVPERTLHPRPNFNFFESKTGLDRGKLRGTAFVIRINKNMNEYPAIKATEYFWGDPKGMVLIGFNDVAVFKASDRKDFVVVAERKGLYV